MTESGSRLAYSSRMRREVVAIADLMSEYTGVMPLPAPRATSSTGVEPVGVSWKYPAGGATSTVSPSTRRSSIQLETTPPATRLTVTCNSTSTAGDDDME